MTEPIGEAWLTGSESTFADGEFAGDTLGKVWPTLPVEWTGTRIERNGTFPLLVKFIFAEEKLSVQVHPDDAYAGKHERAAGGRGKTEMWYAAGARAGAEVLAGLKPGVTRDSFKRAIEDGTAEDSLLHVPMNSGDAIFIPAGTVHTIGKGLVLCEIQQLSDITYRVFDYNRRDAHGRARELHIEKALAVAKFGEPSPGKIAPAKIVQGPVTKTFFAECPYFATEKWEFSTPIKAVTNTERFELLIILEGGGVIAAAGEKIAYARAQAFLFPAALGAFTLQPSSPTSLLRTYVPSGPAEFSAPLVAAGIDSATIAKLVHP